MNESIFLSAHAALTFAYRFSYDQYERPLMNRLATKYVGSGKGLAGLDGAAQAGIIRAEVAALGKIRDAIVVAWHAPWTLPCSCKSPCCSGEKPNQEFQEAISIISDHAVTLLSGKLSNGRLRRAIVMRCFRVPQKLSDVAEACGVHRDTVSDHSRIIKRWLSEKDGEIEKSITAAEQRLVAAGIVEEVTHY
jgi:hypothetical protein